MLHNSDVIKALFPLELSGVSDDDIAIEGKHLDNEEAQIDLLVAEMFPDSSVVLLTWWERVFGINPEIGETLQQRQNAVVQAVRAKGGLSIPYLISLAGALGYTITIDEYRPFMAGIGCAGDEINIYDSIFAFKVTAPAVYAYYFIAGKSSAGEPLGAANGNAKITDMINKLKPAWAFADFEYTAV